MFGWRKKTLTRTEKLQLKAAYAAGKVGPRVAKAAGVTAAKVGPHVAKAAEVTAAKVGPHVEKARDYAAPRLSALGATAAVAVAPRIDTARRRSGAAFDALRGVDPVVVRNRRRWPVAMGAMGIGMVAGAVVRAFRTPMASVTPLATVPTVIPGRPDVVVLDDAHAGESDSHEHDHDEHGHDKHGHDKHGHDKRGHEAHEHAGDDQH